MSFIHLHNHTHFSLLDGATKIDGLIEKAVQYNMPALAITDHGNMFGVFEFYNKAKKAGIKPLIGIEAYVAPYSIYDEKAKKDKSRPRYHHLVLLAKNKTGYQNLLKLSSIAFLEGFYYKPRIDKELLAKYKEGLIASSACMHGEIFHLLKNVSKESAISAVEEYLQLFGDDFYLEIQDHGIPEEAGYEKVYQLAKEMNVPVIATNDIHYLEKEHSTSHDILLCLQTGKDYDDPKRMRYGTDQLYMKSTDEMFQLFKDKPEVIERTLEIGEKCDLEIETGDYKLPLFPLPEEEGNITLDEYLEKITRKGIAEKYEVITPEIEERLKFELSTIKEMKFPGYFLITQDFIDYAKKNDIPVGLGRGSAAGSIVAYSLGITGVDPLKYDLLFERFLNPHRQNMPDIDIDFCYERREEVIDYVRKKYGGEKSVVQIITFGTMASKGVIKDVARVLKIPYSDADKISKLIPLEGAKPICVERAFKEVTELKEILQNGDESIKQLYQHSKVLEGLARHASTHAAGVIIAPDEVPNFVPLYKSTDGETSTQWNMTECEEIGLLKMDFLGLRTLTVIHHAVKFIEKNHNIKLDIENLTLDDPKTYRLFSRGNTVGVFQFESRGMQEYLRKLKPDRIEHLVAMNALYRPGPMANIDKFIEGKENPDSVKYLHPKLEPFLKETYGIIVYQEQVMLIAANLGGFSLAEADTMRKAMGKKKLELMKKFEAKFIDGCVKNDIPRNTAEDMWNLIVEFAKYGFNKSHSVAYATIAYHTAYLKANYPSEYMAATLNSEIDKWEKVQFFITECRSMGKKVLPPNINTSEAYFTPLPEGNIVFGLSAIKNVGMVAINSVVEARKKIGQFTDMYQLMREVDTRVVNRRVMESLIVAGALNDLEGNRRQKFIAIEEALAFASKWSSQKSKQSQPSLFDQLGIEDNPMDKLIQTPELPNVEDWSFMEKLKIEQELFGFYFSGHPLDRYKTEITSFSNVDYSKLNMVGLKAVVRLAGFINSKKVIRDRQGREMAFFDLDYMGMKIEAMIYASRYAEFSNLLENGNVIFAKGIRNEKSEDEFKMIVDEVIPISEIRARFSEGLCINIDKINANSDNMREFKELSQKYPGEHKLAFKVNSPEYFRDMNKQKGDVKIVTTYSKKIKIALDEEFVEKAKQIFG
ncbi:MAG: DNA polymerase III subunit alpha, partial [Calditrichia bacterium]|nr:DNA polymerase III subunit alpha [Calditrichia bacterium]